MVFFPHSFCASVFHINDQADIIFLIFKFLTWSCIVNPHHLLQHIISADSSFRSRFLSKTHTCDPEVISWCIIIEYIFYFEDIWFFFHRQGFIPQDQMQCFHHIFVLLILFITILTVLPSSQIVTPRQS